MNVALRVERPQLLTAMVCERIRSAIVQGELQLGEQVSEAQLAQRMGVSKTPVREALLKLKGEGLVEIHPQRGTFVFLLDPERVGQLCRYRATIETAALREAAAIDAPKLAADMAARVAGMKKAQRARDEDELARLDMDFHWQFFVHSPNPYLVAGYEVIRSQLIAMRHRAPIDNPVSSHQVLVDAVAARDIDRACDLLVRHVCENEERYSAACRAGGPAREQPAHAARVPRWPARRRTTGLPG
jgi:DNA-binding GntR family transcriptional regulator